MIFKMKWKIAILCRECLSAEMGEIMNEIDYYFVYKCLERLVFTRKLTRKVADKILKEYEQEIKPTFTYTFKRDSKPMK